MHEPTRTFTLEEANRTLPLVRRIVKDIVELYPTFQAQLQTLHEFSDAALDDAVQERLAELRADVDRTAEQINAYVQELLQIGCLLKGFEEGLVDFASVYQGRPIFLCWKLGEDRIRYWHEVDAGYAGRQPITPDMAAALAAPVPGPDGGPTRTRSGAH